MMRVSEEDLDLRFNHHAPDANRVNMHEVVRDECKKLAQILTYMLPESREASLALTKLEETMFWANAAVARHV